jgi:hypothetical protein
MNVCVLNFSGNVGKSTLAHHLLAHRLGASVVSVETVNSDGPSDGAGAERIRAKQYGELQSRLASPAGAVVDVGSSNVEEFLRLMGHFSGSHEDFDLFVVPTVNGAKQQIDTINTIRVLRGLGVPGPAIRVVINRAEQGDDVMRDFQPVFSFCEDGAAHTSPQSVIFNNEVFEMLKEMDMSFATLDTDRTDYRQLVRNATDEVERENAVRMLAMKRLGLTCKQNLDVVFSSVMPV